MLSIFALVAVIAAAVQIYKTANSTGRNGALWAFITVAIGIGFQWVIPLAIGIVLGIVMVASGTPVDDIQNKIQGPATIIGFITIGLSFLGVWLVFKHVSKVPNDVPAARVPQPPTF
jgi:hypothetical protein